MSIRTPPSEDEHGEARPEIVVDFAVVPDEETGKHDLFIVLAGFTTRDDAIEYARGFAYGIKLWQERQNSTTH